MENQSAWYNTLSPFPGFMIVICTETVQLTVPLSAMCIKKSLQRLKEGEGRNHHK